MKRTAVLVVAALMVAGLAVLATGVECQKRFLFSIEEKTIMLGTGTLDFSEHPDVTKPDATGNFWSDPWYLKLETNTKVRVSVLASKFTREGSWYALPTWIEGWDAFNFVHAWVPSSSLKPIVSKYFSAGQREGWIRLRVTRKGISDPAGKYVATVKVTATAV